MHCFRKAHLVSSGPFLLAAKPLSADLVFQRVSENFGSAGIMLNI
jgi:hypothetical protein